MTHILEQYNKDDNEPGVGEWSQSWGAGPGTDHTCDCDHQLLSASTDSFVHGSLKLWRAENIIVNAYKNILSFNLYIYLLMLIAEVKVLEYNRRWVLSVKTRRRRRRTSWPGSPSSPRTSANPRDADKNVRSRVQWWGWENYVLRWLPMTSELKSVNFCCSTNLTTSESRQYPRSCVLDVESASRNVPSRQWPSSTFPPTLRTTPPTGTPRTASNSTVCPSPDLEKC